MRNSTHTRLIEFLLALIITAFVVLLMLMAGKLTARDSTDSPTKRSGMGLHIDHQTGCHYLSRGHGMTPRLNRDGTPYCDSR